MLNVQSTITRILESDLGVASGYRHVPKTVVSHSPVALRSALLKWYDVHPVARPVPQEIRDLALKPLLEAVLKADGLGFVVLHRCGDSFYFLIVSTWRNENELWETVWYKDGGMADFAEFKRANSSVPTYCVWELVPVWAEQQAWVRFLESSRDEPAVHRWLADQYSGVA